MIKFFDRHTFKRLAVLAPLCISLAGCEHFPWQPPGGQGESSGAYPRSGVATITIDAKGGLFVRDPKGREFPKVKLPIRTTELLAHKNVAIITLRGSHFMLVEDGFGSYYKIDLPD